jgi:DNA-directed RNA polymerase subunit RPC12/RpoP
MRKLKCPICKHEWKISYLRWLFTSPFHCFSFKAWRDKRKTKCPNCGEKSWITSEKDVKA